MKNFYFDNFGNNSFLVYKLTEEDTLDEISLNMITNNEITGVLKAIVSQLDNEKFIKYNITSKVQASKLFADNVNKKRVLDVFEKIVKSSLEIENYLIPVERLLFNLENIYVDVTTNETSLICLPIEEQNEKVDLKEFFKNILFDTKFDQKENNDYVGRLINSLNSMSEFSSTKFLQTIDEIRGKNQEEAKREIQENSTSNVNTDKNKPHRETLNNEVNDSSNKAVVKEESSFSSEDEITENKSKDEKKKPFISLPNFKKNKEDVEKVEEEFDDDLDDENEEKITFASLLTGFTGEKFKKYKEQQKRKKNKKTNSKSKDKKGITEFKKPKETINKEKYNFDKLDNNKPDNKKEEINSGMKKEEKKIEEPVQKGRYGDFGDTTVLGNNSNANETTVLTDSSLEEDVTSEQRAFLIREKNNERILIDSDIFKIGAEKSYVNYHIHDNTSISRSHAIISKVADNYYIEDTNSTNHTYLNQEKLTPNTKIEIEDNDEVKLADEKFRFTLI